MEGNVKYKLVCIDLDGTVLNSRKGISKENKEAIKRLVENNVKVVISTGRMFNDASYFAKSLNLDYPIIASNGSIVKRINGEYIYKSPIEKNVIRKVMNILRKYNVNFNIHTEKNIYCSKMLSKYALNIYMLKQLKFKGIEVNTFYYKEDSKWNEFIENHQVLKCLAYSHNELNIDKVISELKNIKEINIFKAGKCAVEINSCNSSKGIGINKIMELYGIGKEEVVCIGDGENDISMMREVGVPIAMGNAIEKVKKEAKYITDENDENGVAKAIKNIYEGKINNL